MVTWSFARHFYKQGDKAQTEFFENLLNLGPYVLKVNIPFIRLYWLIQYALNNTDI